MDRCASAGSWYHAHGRPGGPRTGSTAGRGVRARGKRAIDAVLLGTGTSVGVPLIGCDCPVCTSADPRNRRLRCSLLVRHGERRLLVDCGPDFRQQALREGLRRVDAVYLTHEHMDHVSGMDDLRLLVIRRPDRAPIPIHAREHVLEVVRRIYAYAFDPVVETFKPRFDLVPLPDTDEPVTLDGVTLQPVTVDHGYTSVAGLRIGDLAYIPDCKRVSPEALARLQGLDVLVLDGLRWKETPTHLSIEEALALVETLRPRQTFLTHLSHDVDAADEVRLPAGVGFAYDGQVLPLNGLA